MPSNKKGFTLIELLIVVVIIGILAAIAIPKFASTKDKAYIAAMKSDLRNLATYEEQYAADNNGAYFGGTASGIIGTTPAVVLNGFTPSQNVTVTASLQAGPPQSWTATSSHALTNKTCTNASGAIVCT
jgi:prepilin-type N-terminal cleavage/methylation domain-containing protein